MEEYREKQIAKETMITELGTYNYLRLTDNQFGQLLSILLELKQEMMDDSEENRKAIIRNPFYFIRVIQYIFSITGITSNTSEEQKTKETKA